MRMASWGLLVNGPIGHLWYLALESVVRLPGASGIVAKVVVDQAIWTPPLTYAFFMYEGCLQGESPEHASSVATSKLLPTLKANWVVWPVVHLATFSGVPLAYRVLWVNCANFLWSGFLSAQAHSGSGDAADPKGDDAAGKKKVFNRRSQSVCPKV